ncbi:biliverdin-producing heme oxygenase [Sphingomonas fuzhouensis]|uniref:biliverdin-producing heme oxygenase n=1 Tax=Sphingomonas fuzhouensis TaxID=3106033 RepID=UPI002AFF086E|nr:biliverdin-producing heme oxygenase [Sphingomonas sp. SGZ-02]
MDATRSAHDRLDAHIMAAEPFRDRDRYVRLLRMQYRFHHHVDPFYLMPLPLPAALDMPARRRLDRVRQDLADLGEAPPPAHHHGLPDPHRTDPMTAIGWLWVAEGSNLGAASLSKRAATLGLDGSFGARHLAAHPDGRGASWKAFTKAVNQLDLDHADNARMLQGARDAFAHVRMLADAAFS